MRSKNGTIAIFISTPNLMLYAQINIGVTNGNLCEFIGVQEVSVCVVANLG